MAAFELCFNIGKEFLKKKVSGENAFDLISVFLVQTQHPKSISTATTAFVFLENLLNFTITKYLKQARGLSITRDIKIYQCHVIKS